MNRKTHYLFLSILTFSISMTALYIHRHRIGQTTKIDNFFIEVIGRIENVFHAIATQTHRFQENYLYLQHVKEDNERLTLENNKLKSKLAELNEVIQDNERLSKALEFKKKIPEKLILARIISQDVSSDFLSLRVHRGSIDGVKVGFGVISDEGVVGRVVRVSSNFSDIRTVEDPSSNIDVVIQRSRARGILQGDYVAKKAKIKYLDRLEDVAEGDIVVSSGFGGTFPKGTLIGYVDSIHVDSSGILQNVTVKSAVDFNRLEEVFIVVPTLSTEAGKSF